MKRNLLLSTLLLASASMAAQGFDGSFDEPWETCYPDGKTAVGTQPKGWMASSVCKKLYYHDYRRTCGSGYRPYGGSQRPFR